MRLYYGADAKTAACISRIIWGDDRGFSDGFRAIGVQSEITGFVVGGVVYHNWDPDTGVIEMSAGSISKRWLTKHLIKELLAYPFQGCGCQMVIWRTKADNEPVINLAQGLGFKPQTISRLYGRHCDGFLWTLTDDDWKAGRYYRKIENEQAKTSYAA